VKAITAATGEKVLVGTGPFFRGRMRFSAVNEAARDVVARFLNSAADECWVWHLYKDPGGKWGYALNFDNSAPFDTPCANQQ